ncbi:fumarylacetoacetate hydrolase family protein [Fictibacillus sp. KU28468]|uniref:fumarylacetoacetate hydrolase family protein n=1 Tax=Fictibacillus sp. KU28468 TaxID=2991053 RepID=UPI00223E50F9|nr:fumarylacetoacetate hydrolase family protein [Fictibacillus sp. KU28468]UZJ79507.1 fumarylacetoacetate hydrolase family protein [Fictibacillus sp. KU28468]
MKTLTFKKDGEWTLGVKTEGGILDVKEAVRLRMADTEGIPVTVDELILQGEKGKEALQRLADTELASREGVFYPEDSLTLGPCVVSPQKIICVGLNYKKHAEESNMALPETPILFSKFSNALAGHLQEVKIPERSLQVDYEVELGLVIGKTASKVEVDEAINYVYGYCTANDLSARDLQFKTGQWLLGKTCDGFSPTGPYLVSSDEIEDPNQLGLKTVLNGTVRQDSNTADMVFSCEEIISYVSQHMTLYPGDLILTGTPEGVIMGEPEGERFWLKDGDEVTVEVEGLGKLTTIMRK